MLKFSVKILGCSSAMPTTTRMPTAQLISYNTNTYLIDCAEGTQLQLRKMNCSLLKINNIFISHLHGDHFYGFFGLISTFNMLGRKNKLNIFAPKELFDIYKAIQQIKKEDLGYDINFIALNPDGKRKIFDDKYIEVYSFPLKHSIQVWGFLFSEKEKTLNIKKSAIEEYILSIKEILKIKKGENYTNEKGEIINNSELTVPPPPIRNYAYCTDTLPIKSINKYFQNVDLLYHESTYCSDKKTNAKKHFHSTAQQAAEIAKITNAKKLVIGHYSSSYPTTEIFLKEAKEIFENTVAAYDGLEIEIL